MYGAPENSFKLSVRALFPSVAELHHFYAAPAPGINFYAAPAPGLRLLPYYIVKIKFWNKLLFKHMLKLSCSYDPVRYMYTVLLKIWPEWVITKVTFCVIFQFLTMFNAIVGAWAAGAASRYGSGSDQLMRLLAASAPAPQHCFSYWCNHNVIACLELKKNFEVDLMIHWCCIICCRDSIHNSMTTAESETNFSSNSI
jgi:hypothetical protein